MLHRGLAQDEGCQASSQIFDGIGRSSSSLKITQRQSRRKSSSTAFLAQTGVQDSPMELFYF